MAEHISQAEGAENTAEHLEDSLHDKVQRYGWRLQDDSQKGTFKEIRKELLNIDHEKYQREHIESRVLKLAKGWFWIACGVLIVARRPDGRLFILDGQHRKMAADRRGDITHLPCIIFDVEEIEAEADAFRVTNTLHKPLTAMEKWKSLITAGDPVATVVQEALARHNLFLGHGTESRRGIRCISLLLTLFTENRELADDALGAALQLTNERTLPQELLMGLYQLERRCRKVSMTCIDEKSIAKLNEYGGYTRIRQKAVAMRIDYELGSLTKGMIEAIVFMLNKGRRKNFLPSKISGGEE